MGYLFIGLALLFGLTKGFCGKKIGNITENLKDGIYFTSFRMLFCTAVGLTVLLFSKIPLALANSAALPICVLSAIGMSVFCVSWLLAVKNESYMFISVSTMLGSMSATIFSSLLYRENIRFGQVIGMLLLLASIFVMHSYNTSIKGNMTPIQFLILVICGVSAGSVEFAQKSYMKLVGTYPQALNFYTYFFSLIILFAVSLVMRKKSAEKSSGFNIKNIIVYVSIMAVCLYANSLFTTCAAGLLPAATLYPMLQGASLVLSSIMAAIFFGEKITLKGYIGISAALAALICVNI